MRGFGLEAFVARLGGLFADVGPATLSAGKRQLIVLARSGLSGAGIAVLDEATCFLDPAAGARAEAAFARGGCTLIVIAHRILGAARPADPGDRRGQRPGRHPH